MRSRCHDRSGQFPISPVGAGEDIDNGNVLVPREPLPNWTQARLSRFSRPPERTDVTVGFTGTVIVGFVAHPARLGISPSKCRRHPDRVELALRQAFRSGLTLTSWAAGARPAVERGSVSIRRVRPERRNPSRAVRWRPIHVSRELT